MNVLSHLLLLLLRFIVLAALFSPQKVTANGGKMAMSEESHVNGIIGAIVDETSRVGKEAKVAMEMALDDFNTKNNQSFALHMRNSQSKPFQAALAARDLIDTGRVKAILGLHKWEDASLVADIGSQARVPIFSLADSTPQWAISRWPFLVQASPNQSSQMKAVASILQSWGQNCLTLLYEEGNDSTSSNVIPLLTNALHEIGAEINSTIPLFPPFNSSSLEEELKGFKNEQCRVFLVHTSLELAVHLFDSAKKMEMMTNGYAWITTNRITDFLHSVNDSTISSMQGILGVQTYVPENNPQFRAFKRRFRGKFSIEYPKEDIIEPGIFAVQAYDATWVVLALELEDSLGEKLLEKDSLIDFNGLSGKIHFRGRKLAAAHIFQIVNVIGKSYNAFWSEGLGFSEAIDHDKTIYNSSMQKLGQVYRPGRLNTLPTSAKPLRVGVPTGSVFNQFVKIENNSRTNKHSYSGFSIEVFEATMASLRYNLPYEFFPFHGTYDELVEQVHLENFDAAAGDITILVNRTWLADFTQPYSESGLEMIVLIQSKMPNKAWLFMKPFTKAMWGLIGVVTVYNGFVLWLIERNHSQELKGSVLNQIGTLLWLAFTTLFSLHGEKLHSNLSRMTIVMWLFVALIITQSYTASLASMLTTERLVPRISDVETLKKMNSSVGYCRGSFVASYLKNVLHFEADKVKKYNLTDEYAQALQSGEINAIFLEVPSAKLFLARYCKTVMRAGVTFKVGGFGFAFRKNYPLLADINRALLNVSESGEIKHIEARMIGNEKCVDGQVLYNDTASLSLNSFWVLFALTGGTSTIALSIYVIVSMFEVNDDQNSENEQRSIYAILLAVSKKYRQARRQFSNRVSSVESPTNHHPATPDHWASV